MFKFDFMFVLFNSKKKRKASKETNALLKAILKFSTTNQLLTTLLWLSI